METWETRLAGYNWQDDEKKLFRQFADDATSLNIGHRRIEKYRTDLIIACRMANMGLSQILKNIDSLKKAIMKINEDKTYKWETKKDAKRTLGSLYHFKHYKDRSLKYAPKEIRQIIEHKKKASDKRIAKPIILRQEMREMVKHADIQDRALLSLLFETGMRIGEFISLRRKDIMQIEEGLDINVPAGKTGERRIVAVEPTKYVMAWLDRHPLKNPDSPLWIDERTKKPIEGAGITKRIKKIVLRMNEARKKQGLPLFSKDHNPHNFRHSRASELGGEAGMTEQIMDKFFGWELDSPMPKIYMHLTDEQVKRAVLRTYGHAKKDEEKIIITEKLCQRCHEKNPLSAGFCLKCGTNLETNKLPSKIEALEERLRQVEKQLLREKLGKKTQSA